MAMGPASLTSLISLAVMIPRLYAGSALQKESCPMTFTTTEPGGYVLMQSSSSRERFGVDASIGNIQPPTALQIQLESSVASTNGDRNPGVGVTNSTKFHEPFNFSLAFVHMSSLLQEEGLIVRAVARFKDLCGHGADSAVPFILAFLLLVVIIGVVCWLISPPSANPIRVEFPSGPVENQSLTADMLARGRYDPRAYASSTPNILSQKREQGPLERAHSSPHITSNSPVPFINIPRGRTPPRPGHQSQAIRNSNTNYSPRLTGGMSAAPSNSGNEPTNYPRASSAESQFCPELIVPPNCECILLVPLDDQKYSSFDVTDCNGSCVLRVVPQAPTAGRLWRATITSASGELLAQCCEASYQASSRYAPEFHLLQAGGQMWAKLLHSPHQDRYLLNFVKGGMLHFWGSLEEHAVNITNETNQLLATTEIGSADFDPNGKYYRLRVAPTADVGLAVCGLLCIGQHMANQRKDASI